MLSEWMNHCFCLGIWNPETGWSTAHLDSGHSSKHCPTLGWGRGWSSRTHPPCKYFCPMTALGPCLLRVVLLSALLNSVSITLDFVDLPQNGPVFAGPCLDKLPYSSLCPTHPVQWSHKSQQQATAVSIISTTKGAPFPTFWTQVL